MSDFVNFKLAQKLKEKGFRKPCILYYNSDKVRTWFNEPDIAKNFVPTTLGNDDVLVPTISQVLKWLREEKDIFIGLEYINQEACGCTIIIQKTGGLIAKWNWDKFQYVDKNPLIGNTYEQAALAGIEYSLDNLI